MFISIIYLYGLLTDIFHVKHVIHVYTYSRIHVYACSPAIKVWLYAEEVTNPQGPFSVVPGSHRLSEGKARWLYNVSNR